MKKYIALCLCLILIGSLAACTPAVETTEGTNATTAGTTVATTTETTKASLLNNYGTFPIVSEDVTMSMTLMVNASDKAPNDMWFFQYYKELTGVNWEITGILASDWGEKKPIIMATGEYTDVYWRGGWGNNEIYLNGSNGIFIDLKPYMDYAPDFVAEMDKIEGSWNYITTPDSKIYSLTPITPLNFLSSVFFYVNGAWLDNLSLNKPETIDDFYNVLTAFKEEDADGDGDTTDEIPYGAYWSGAMRRMMLNSFGFDTSTSGDIALATWNDNEVVYMPLTARYKEYLVYMNKLMEEGLIDSELFTQDETQFKAKSTQGVYGGFGGQASYYLDPEHQDDYVAICLSYDKASQKIAYQSPPVSNGIWTVTDKCEHPDVAMAWINLFYQPVHANNILGGPTIYKYEGSDELIFATPGITEDPRVGAIVTVSSDGKFISSAIPGYDDTVKEKYGLWDWLCLDHPGNGAFQSTIGEIYYLTKLFQYSADNWQDAAQQQLERYQTAEDPTNAGEGWSRYQDITTCYEHLRHGYPIVYFTKEQQDWLDEYATLITDYVSQMEAKFITGAADIGTEYDAFITELKNLGAEDYEKIYQEAYPDN